MCRIALSKKQSHKSYFHMNYARRNSDEVQHERILRITKLLEDGKAGINRVGKIVDLRKSRGAFRISLSTLQAARVLMKTTDIHIKR